MVSIAATLSIEPWGPERWQRFAYWPNANRLGDGNPVYIHRHGGGGWQGSWLSPTNGTLDWPMLQCFLLNNSILPFDVISVQTSEQTITGASAANYRKTQRKNMWDNVIDHKRMIQGIKAWGTGLLGQGTYKINPDKIICGGDSFGATVSALSMITPPLPAETSWAAAATGVLESRRFDSRAQGVWFYRGQVDFRKRLLPNPVSLALLDYLSWEAVGGIWGTRDNSGVGDTSAEWDAVPSQFKDSVSLLYYLENGLTDYYTSMFVTYWNDPTMPGTFPLADNHDKRMFTDLTAALRSKGLDFQQSLTPNAAPDGGIAYSPDLETQARVYRWACDRVSKRRALTGTVR